MPPRSPVLLLVLAAMGVLILPALYTHHRDPTYIPSLFHSPLPAHIVVPSGGNHDLPMTLEARLTDLLARPALEQWETELASRHGCPFYTYSRNTYFFHTEDKIKLWEGLGKSDIRRYRSKMVEYLRNVEREGQKLVWEKGMDDHVPLDRRRGLIFTGGKGKTIERLKLSLHMLRNVIGSKIPVELYHYPDEMEDEAVKKDLVDKYDITIRAIGQRVGSDENWVIKNEAFIATDFTEFVYLDSDNIPLRDPAELFDSVEYKNSGSVFWSDLNKDHPDNAIFRIMGRYCSDEHWPAETGQMLFDKRGNNGLNLAILHLANHMMKERDMYYFLSYGDKDTFRYAHYALGLDYQMNSHQFATAGGYQDSQGQDTPTSFCGHSLIQWGLTPQSMVNDKDYHPEPFFLHTILAKHKQNLQPSKLFSHVNKPRLDRINEPLLVRTLYEFNGQCFDINLKGPDGHADTENGMGDGQGVLMLNTRDVVGAETWKGLQALSEQFVAI